MKKLILLSFLSHLIWFSDNAQRTVELSDIRNHIGENVMVTGKVFTTSYLKEEKGSITFLNLGAASPNQLLTIVIKGKDYKKFNDLPANNFKDKIVSIVGKLELVKNTPRIVVHNYTDIISIDIQKELE